MGCAQCSRQNVEIKSKSAEEIKSKNKVSGGESSRPHRIELDGAPSKHNELPNVFLIQTKCNDNVKDTNNNVLVDEKNLLSKKNISMKVDCSMTTNKFKEICS